MHCTSPVAALRRFALGMLAHWHAARCDAFERRAGWAFVHGKRDIASMYLARAHDARAAYRFALARR